MIVIAAPAHQYHPDLRMHSRILAVKFSVPVAFVLYWIRGHTPCHRWRSGDRETSDDGALESRPSNFRMATKTDPELTIAGLGPLTGTPHDSLDSLDSLPLPLRYEARTSSNIETRKATISNVIRLKTRVCGVCLPAHSIHC
jgi:hypothetical protein